MKTRIFIGLTVMLMTLFGVTVYANENNDNPTTEANIDGLNYFLGFTTHEATITTGHTVSGELNIPSEINYKGETFVVKGMAWCSFYNNQGLTKVTIPKTVEGILNYVPHNPEDETSGAVAPIYMNPFKGCTALESIEVDEENPSFKSVDGVLFSQDGVGQYYYHTNNYKGTGLYCYPEGKQQHIYTIPDGVEWIGGGAVSNNKYLTTLTIPNSMKHICTSAFEGCSNLKELYCKADNVPVVWESVFKDVPIASATLHVPEGSIEKYKATSPWKDFGNIVPITYYPEGTKWTEIRLDTLKYDSWYSKVGDEWVPNFETVDYYVKGEYDGGYWDYKLIYTNGPEWTDSLTLLISESQWGIEVSVAIFNEDGVPFYPGRAYMFDDWREGYMLSYQTIDGANIPSLPAVGIKDYGTITEIKEGYFGGEKLLKYVDLNGIRIIHGIGVTEWNDGECIFGPVDPYSCYYGTYPGMPKNRDYRSMLVHFERNGEVLYDVWPAKETVSYTKNQMATIILPSAPDASKGKYYGLDRCEEGKIIFTEELQPKARVPYIIVPKEDFTIDLSKLELESLLSDTVSVKGAMFIGSYNSAEMNCQEGFYIDIIDATPDCQIIGTDQRKAAIGALRAFLIAPWDDPYTQGPTKGIKNKRELILKDNPNGIESLIPNPSPREGGAIYDLSGRKIDSSLFTLHSSLKRGLYIQNGKKIIVK